MTIIATNLPREILRNIFGKTIVSAGEIEPIRRLATRGEGNLKKPVMVGMLSECQVLIETSCMGQCLRKMREIKNGKDEKVGNRTWISRI